MRIIVALVAGLGLVCGPAAGSELLATEGRTLVGTYCAACHAIERAGASPHPEAPPFRTLHERYDVTWLEEALVEGIFTGHEDMPIFAFDPEQAAAIVAYLKTLE